MIISETTYKKMPERLKRMFDELPNPGRDEVVGLFPVTKSGTKTPEHKRNVPRLGNSTYGDNAGTQPPRV